MELGDSATMTVPPGALRHCRTPNYTRDPVKPQIGLGFARAACQRSGGWLQPYRRTIGYKDMCADDKFLWCALFVAGGVPPFAGPHDAAASGACVRAFLILQRRLP